MITLPDLITAQHVDATRRNKAGRCAPGEFPFVQDTLAAA
jgi:hypothetical protein